MAVDEGTGRVTWSSPAAEASTLCLDSSCHLSGVERKGLFPAFAGGQAQGAPFTSRPAPLAPPLLPLCRPRRQAGPPRSSLGPCRRGLSISPQRRKWLGWQWVPTYHTRDLLGSSVPESLRRTPQPAFLSPDRGWPQKLTFVSFKV